MIGNKYLQKLFMYTDESTSFNQLLEHLKSKDSQFLKSLIDDPVDFNVVTKEELVFLTKASALIDRMTHANSLL